MKLLFTQGRGTAWAAWSRADTDDAFNVHCVHICELNTTRKKSGWINHWTRLPANVLTPCALETQTLTVSWLLWSSHNRSLIFNSTRHQNISWESCPSSDRSVEHSRKPKSTLIRARFLFFFIHIHGTMDTVDIERVFSVHTWSKLPRLSPSDA